MPDTDALTLAPRVCVAELLCEAPVVMTDEVRTRIVADIHTSLGDVGVLRSEGALLHLALEQHPVQYEDGVVPAQALLVSATSPAMKPDPQKAAETLETSLSHTRGWREARDVVERARHTLLVSDFLATGLEPHERLRIFPHILHAAAKHIPSAALHFPGSQCLIDPEDFCANVPGDEDGYPLLGLVNVRLFSVEQGEDTVVMDTIGLNVFGLPDLQCRIGGTSPDELAPWLYSLAADVAEADSLVGDGDTVDFFDGAPMRLRYVESLAWPRRVVLDIAKC